MSRSLKKWLFITGIALATVLTAGFLFAKFWLDPLLEAQLVAAVAQSGKGVYALRMDRLHVNIFTGTVKMDHIRLDTDTLRWQALRLENPATLPPKITLSLHHLRIKDIGWIKYWRNQHIDVDGIQLVEPQLDMTAVLDSAQRRALANDSLKIPLLDRLPALIGPYTPELHIGYVAISKGKISLRNEREGKATIQQADSINGVFSHFRVTAQPTNEAPKALYCKHILLNLRNYELQPGRGLYGFRIQSIALDGQDDVIRLANVEMTPTVSDAVFMQQQKHRVSRLKIFTKEIEVQKLDLFQAIHRKVWAVQSVTLNGARFNVYQDKNMPLPAHKNMPNEWVRTLRTPFSIDTVVLRNSHILYTELLGTDKGQLEFENANGIVLNITNDSLKMTDETPAQVNARAELMGAGILDLSLRIPLLSPTFRCDYVANLGKIDMTYLNRLVADKNHFRVESGNCENIVLKAKVRNGIAEGVLEANYNDLKISILREKDGSKKKLVSAVANLVLRNNNEPGQALQSFKTGRVYYPREPGDGIIRFLWRSAQSGLIETLVPGSIKVKMPEG